MTACIHAVTPAAAPWKRPAPRWGSAELVRWHERAAAPAIEKGPADELGQRQAELAGALAPMKSLAGLGV